MSQCFTSCVMAPRTSATRFAWWLIQTRALGVWLLGHSSAHDNLSGHNGSHLGRFWADLRKVRCLPLQPLNHANRPATVPLRPSAMVPHSSQRLRVSRAMAAKAMETCKMVVAWAQRWWDSISRSLA